MQISKKGYCKKSIDLKKVLENNFKHLVFLIIVFLIAVVQQEEQIV